MQFTFIYVSIAPSTDMVTTEGLRLFKLRISAKLDQTKDRHELSFHFNGSLQVAFMAQHTFYQSHTFHMRGVGGKVPI